MRITKNSCIIASIVFLFLVLGCFNKPPSRYDMEASEKYARSIDYSELKNALNSLLDGINWDCNCGPGTSMPSCEIRAIGYSKFEYDTCYGYKNTSIKMKEATMDVSGGFPGIYNARIIMRVEHISIPGKFGTGGYDVWGKTKCACYSWAVDPELGPDLYHLLQRYSGN